MDWLPWIINALFGVIGWLLANKDAQQGREIAEMKSNFKSEIETLYRLHHADEEKLAEYKLTVLQNHYTQPQVDFKFRQLNDAIKELSADIKSLTKVLTDHLVKEGK